jgi:hypothetical protein
VTETIAAWRVRLDASSCDPKRSLGLDPQRGSPTSGLKTDLRPLAGLVRSALALAVTRATCLTSDPRASTATKHCHPTHLKRICTYECTFCATCVDAILGNVCPNCGGGFVPRPIRPATNWKGDNFLGKNPPSAKVKHRPFDPEAHALFAAAIKNIPPEKR